MNVMKPESNKRCRPKTRVGASASCSARGRPGAGSRLEAFRTEQAVTLSRFFSSQGLALLFLAFGIVVIPCEAYITPPLQVSDELSHFQRADQLRLGRWVGERRDKLSGGEVSIAIGSLADVFWPLVLHPERRANPDMFSKAATIHWDQGLNYSTFENTSIYPPQFYLLSALGIEIGSATGLPVVQTLYLSRILTGLGAVFLGSVAIAVSGSAAAWMFTLLALPMSLSSMASTSQEALLLATASVAAGLYVSIVRKERAGRYDFGVLCLLLAAIATGRLPYVMLALLPLAVPGKPWTARLVGAGTVLAPPAIWSVVVSKYAYVKYGIGDANAPDQLRYLLSNPGAVPHIVWNTFAVDGPLLLESFVGRLGWLDLWLPRAFIVGAWLVLGLAAFLVIAWRLPWRPAAPGITLVALLLSFGAIFGALYLSWSPVGFSYAGGAQGRYFIPLAMFIPAIFPAPEGAGQPGVAWRRVAAIPVLVFPLVSFGISVAGIIDRYYR